MPGSWRSSRWRPLLPLVLATMSSQAVLVVLAPTIVDVARELDASVGAVGQARTVTAATAIASTAVIGSAIDRLGVRRVLAWGTVLAAAGLALAAAAPSLGTYLAAHVPAGIGFACLLSCGFAGVASFPREQAAWAMGYVAGANALAWVIANPLIGLLTEAISWRAAHLVPVAIAMLALASARDAPGAGGRTDVARVGLLGVLRDRPARRWALAELAMFFGWAGSLIFVGALLIEAHELGEASVGLLLALVAAAYFLSATRGGPLVHRLPRRRLVAAAALGMAVLLPLLFALRGDVWVSAALFGVVGVLAGLRTPASSALGMAQLPDRPGSMMAARTATTQLGYMLGAVVGGAMLAWSGFAELGAVFGVAMLGSALLILRVRDPEQPVSRPGPLPQGPAG